MEEMAYIRALGIPGVCLFALLAVFAIARIWKERRKNQKMLDEIVREYGKDWN